MHLQATDDILHQHENSVGGQERLWYHQATVRTVVERALEELDTVGLIRVRLEAENKARERIDSLAPHRISFICHGRRADLLFLERLLDLAHGLQDAQIARELGGAGGDAGNSAQDLRVELARVSLP